jgi:hypothetical protein
MHPGVSVCSLVPFCPPLAWLYVRVHIHILQHAFAEHTFKGLLQFIHLLLQLSQLAGSGLKGPKLTLPCPNNTYVVCVCCARARVCVCVCVCVRVLLLPGRPRVLHLFCLFVLPHHAFVSVWALRTLNKSMAECFGKLSEDSGDTRRVYWQVRLYVATHTLREDQQRLLPSII